MSGDDTPDDFSADQAGSTTRQVLARQAPADLKSAAELLMNGHISKYPIEDFEKGGEFQRGMLSGLLTSYELMVSPESYAGDARVRAAETLLTKMFLALYPRGAAPATYQPRGLVEFAKQGEPLPPSAISQCCSVCSGELPCRNHPAPPVLTFIGGTHFDEAPSYRTSERAPERASTDNNRGADDPASGGDDSARPPAGGPLAAASSGDTPFGWPPVRPEVSGAVPVSSCVPNPGQVPEQVPEQVQEASARLSTASNVVVLGGDTTLDIPPERVLAGAKQLRDVIVLGYDEAGHEYFASSLGDPTEQLWLVERFKLMLMDPP